jgi:hypothetical protein
MKNIQLVAKGENFIRISFEEDNQPHEVDITQPRAIEAILTLGEALQKDSFLNLK